MLNVAELIWLFLLWSFLFPLLLLLSSFLAYQYVPIWKPDSSYVRLLCCQYSIHNSVRFYWWHNLLDAWKGSEYFQVKVLHMAQYRIWLILHYTKIFAVGHTHTPTHRSSSQILAHLWGMGWIYTFTRHNGHLVSPRPMS